MSHVLFLSRWAPYPPSNGSRLRVYGLLRALAREHRITLLSFAEPGQELRPAPVLDALCEKVQFVTWRPYAPRSSKARRALLGTTPRSLVDTFSREMADHIRSVVNADSPDVVIASQIDMAIYHPFFRQVPAIFEEAEVGVLYERFVRAPTLWRRLRYGLTWAKYRHFLFGLFRQFRAVTVASEPEKQLLSRAVPSECPIEVIPNWVELSDYQDIRVSSEPCTLIFTGAFTFRPNYEAMCWFVQAVYPKIQAVVPEVRLVITGDHASLPLPLTRNITLTGFVDDVRPHIAAATVSLAPLMEGGGTRLKILEAMALSVPVVATTKGAEGLNARDGEHLLLADDPDRFAAAVLRLLQDPSLRQQLAKNGARLIEEQYSSTAVAQRVLSLVERVSLQD